jgi:multidrug efflux pump subunit AcrA (membrane-fusion protein)
MTCVVVPLGPACVDITGVRAGDQNLFSMTLTSSGIPVDLTSLTITAQARVNPLALDSISAVIEKVDALAGKITVRWPGDAVTTMLAGKTTWKGVWDLQVDSGANDPVTVAAGKFTANMDVTRP